MNQQHKNEEEQKMGTKAEEDIKSKIKHIYQSLIQLGCNMFEPVPEKQIFGAMQIFFQASDSRLDLLEWLIATINPWYDQDPTFKNSYEEDPHLHRVKKITISLWQLGVMPYSKHTKNLDYCQYVSGLLGVESSVNLVHNLVELGNAKFSSNLPTSLEKAAQGLLGSLISHHNELVNVDYDPYGITFPPSRQIGHNQDDDKEIERQFEEMANELVLERGVDDDESEEQKNDAMELFQEMQENKQLFCHKYEKLAQKIQHYSSKYETLLEGLHNMDQEKQKKLHNSRMLNMEKSLCAKYQEYKKMILQVKEQTYSEELKQLQNSLSLQIQNLNNVDPNYFISS